MKPLAFDAHHDKLIKMPSTSILRMIAAVLPALAAFAQQPGPALTIGAKATLHPSSPDIYGINFYWDVGKNNDPRRAANLAAAADVRATLRRWGGNNTSTYHWKFDVSNIDADWFFEVLPDTSVNASKLPAGSSFNAFPDQARISAGKIMGNIPVPAWLPHARPQIFTLHTPNSAPHCNQTPTPHI